MELQRGPTPTLSGPLIQRFRESPVSGWPKPSRTAILAAFIAALLVAGASCSTSAGSNEPSATPAGGADSEQDLISRDGWGELFDDAGVSGTFALREVGSQITMVWNADRASEPRLPASTFKILNSLIILETGILPDTETVVPWDGVERNVTAWNQDHSLRTGIGVSAVWAYQDLARQVGEERMLEWVTRASYGNMDIGGGIDEFWLRGELRISPLEQLDFLEDFANRELPFQPEVMSAVADILIREQGDGWTWSHKTGTTLAEDPDLGWLVGITEHEGRTFVFAMNLDLEPLTKVDTQLDSQVRQNIAREILAREGALPS